jgi:hypothetical protein
VTGRIVKPEKALGMAIYLALEDVDCAINLSNEFLCIKESIMILPQFEYNVGISEE